MKYLVQWEIDVDADNPYDAAVQAFNLMQDEDTTASFFTVKDEHGHKIEVDLMDMEHKGYL
jgi:hypothetical protein